MNNQWYAQEGWYEPLQHEEKAAHRPDRHESDTKPKRKKRKGLTPARIAGLVVLLLLLIAGSSLAVGGLRSDSAPQDSGFGVEIPSFGDEELPTDPEDFFQQYYVTVDNPTEAEVKVERVSQSPDYQMTLTPQPDEALSLQELYEKCAPSVISISGYVDKKTGYSWGSGVIISEDGLILTNAHILEDCDRAVVELDDGTEYEALLVGSDSISDIALLKIEAEGLPAAELGESASLRVGDSVAAIGNPLGESFRNTLTDGIISAIERDMTYQGRSMTLLQTNTAVNEGNSGGALFNRFGQVIGLTNMKMMSSYSSIEGIGFAIPSNTICKVVNALIRDGEVRGRPAIGITVGSIPENAKERYSLPDGLYISMVSKGSDAEKQGIREGDVLTAVNGIPVTKTTEVSAEKDKLEVGDTMVLTIWRDGESFDVEIALVDTNDIYS